MYVAKVPNRGSPPAVLLRESYREAGKVKNRTLANLSAWPEARVDALSRVLKGQPQPAAGLDEAFEITRSLPHGHVAAVLGTARQLGLDELKSWVMVDEVNETAWPGYDLQTNADGQYAYGFIPPNLFRQIKAEMMQVLKASRLRRVPR